MSITLRIALLIGVLVYAFFILRMLKKKKLSLKYSLLWLLSAFILLIIDAFPPILTGISKLIGIVSPVNAVVTIIIFFILLILIIMTSIVSNQATKIKTLIQNISIMQKQIDELNNNNK